jgi:hypothetical protein
MIQFFQTQTRLNTDHGFEEEGPRVPVVPILTDFIWRERFSARQA